MVAYSSDGRTSVEYAVAFTSGSHWYNACSFNKIKHLSCLIYHCLDMMGPCHGTVQPDSKISILIHNLQGLHIN